jgi:hypothetical protein
MDLDFNPRFPAVGVSLGIGFLPARLIVQAGFFKELSNSWFFQLVLDQQEQK